MLPARHDDDDDIYIYSWCDSQETLSNEHKEYITYITPLFFGGVTPLERIQSANY